MILAWMLAATALGLAACGAAWLGERALRLTGAQGRGAWVAALAVTVVWPLAAPFVVVAPAVAVTTRALAGGGFIATAPTVAASGIDLRGLLAQLDGAALLAWGAITLLLIVRGLRALTALGRTARAADASVVDGTPVLISATTGPAAVGIVRRRILLPSWALDLDAPLREIVLAHEREHLRSGDPALLAAAWFLAAVMPWNAALWVIARRLRAATELDCDVRVLRAGADARTYSNLLLLVSQRQSSARFATLIAGNGSTLHERIDAMHADAPSRPRLRAALLAAAALLLSAAGASPALASELAAVRGSLPAAKADEPSAQEPVQERPRTSQDSLARRRDREIVARRQDSARVVTRRRVDDSTEVVTYRIRAVPADRSEAERRQDAERRAVEVRVRPDRSETERRLDVERRAVEERVQSDRSLRVERDASERDASERERRREIERRAETELEARKRAELERRATLEMTLEEKQQREAELQERPASFAPGGEPSPRYPDILRSAGVSGTVLAQLVVDSSGAVVPGSLRVLQKSHDLFEASVRASLSNVRFTPPRVNDRNVRQLVQFFVRFEASDLPPREVPAFGNVRTFEILVRGAPR